MKINHFLGGAKDGPYCRSHHIKKAIEITKVNIGTIIFINKQPPEKQHYTNGAEYPKFRKEFHYSFVVDEFSFYPILVLQFPIRL